MYSHTEHQKQNTLQKNVLQALYIYEFEIIQTTQENIHLSLYCPKGGMRLTFLCSSQTTEMLENHIILLVVMVLEKYANYIDFKD